MSSFDFACPVCGGALSQVGAASRPRSAPAESSPLTETGEPSLSCPADGNVFRQEAGIWRFVAPDRLAQYGQFIREYETVRKAEGRISTDSAYYRALPFRDLTGHNSGNWRIRARSYQTLLSEAVEPLESSLARPLVILDLGAGNGWLSYQLARRGHRVVAIDLLVNDFDGLGCHIHYDAPFTPVQAEFEHLPLPDGTADLVIFNASLHYATDYATTLAEGLRVLRPGGVLAAVDSPVYHHAASGAQMVREREARFLKEYGFTSNSISSENYLTDDRLGQLEALLGLKWKRVVPFYGLGWALRPWRARLRGHREPARFMVLLARKEGMGTEMHPLRSLPPIPALPRGLWRFLNRLRYRYLARGRYDALVLEEVAGKPILVLPEVFNPKLLRTGEILVRTLNSLLVPSGSSVLDMGTGSGIGAIFAAGWAGNVTAVDINPEAVRCTRINALLNHVEDRVQALHGDLFDPVGEGRFDVVLFNPPYYEGVPRNKLDMAWRSPDVLRRFAAQLPLHLAPGGHALVVLSTDGVQAEFLESFAEAGLEIDVMARRDLGNEVVTVYRLRQKIEDGR